jgi:hypothetical protein
MRHAQLYPVRVRRVGIISILSRVTLHVYRITSASVGLCHTGIERHFINDSRDDDK